MLSIEFVVFGVSVILIFISLAILKRCNEIYSDVERLQDRYFRDIEQLSPLFFMPFKREANDISEAIDSAKRQFDWANDNFERNELREMKAFAATNPSSEMPFPPSHNLKRALETWSIANQNMIVASNWGGMFQDVFVALLQGRLTIEEARSNLTFDPYAIKQFHVSKLMDIHDWDMEIEHRPETENSVKIKESFNDCASRWNAERWRNRLGDLEKTQAWDNQS